MATPTGNTRSIESEYSGQLTVFSKDGTDIEKIIQVDNFDKAVINNNVFKDTLRQATHVRGFGSTGIPTDLYYTIPSNRPYPVNIPGNTDVLNMRFDDGNQMTSKYTVTVEVTVQLKEEIENNLEVQT